MLYEFITAHRDLLIKRCREKMGRRYLPEVTSLELQQGVPLFLAQLVAALRHEQEHAIRPGTPEERRTAALHGRASLDGGYTVDQVVHGYGDICQAITELASEKGAPVTVAEFQTLNRLLDDAIAHAVSAYSRQRDTSAETESAEELHARLGTLAEEQRTLLDAALKALDALKVGNIGIMGATGTLLEDSLTRLRDLIDKSLPEIRLSSGMTSPARRLGEAAPPEQVSAASRRGP